MSDRLCVAVLQKIRNHPNQDRAHEAVMDLIARISAGEPLESIEARYHEDLELIRKGAQA
jgi:hypothetical protein